MGRGSGGAALDPSPNLPDPPTGPHVVDQLFHLGGAEACVLTLACEAVHQATQVFPVQGSVIIKVCDTEPGEPP